MGYPIEGRSYGRDGGAGFSSGGPYDSRPRTVVRALRNKSGLITEVVDTQTETPPDTSVRFDPNEDILGVGDFAVTYRTTFKGRPAAMKVFLPRNPAWNGLPQGSTARNEALKVIADDEWEVLGMGVPGVIRGLGRGEVRLTESLALPFILREFHPHTVSSTAKEIREHEDRTSIMLRAASQLAETLDALRTEHDILVADITPDNVFVDMERNFLVGDVGAAIRLGEDREQLFRGFSFGTPDAMYAPPEFYKGITIPGKEVATSQGQVYSLAALLHFMAGGEPSDRVDRFLGNSFHDLAKLGLPESMVLVLRKALSEKPEDRFDTPGEFAEALQASV